MGLKRKNVSDLYDSGIQFLDSVKLQKANLKLFYSRFEGEMPLDQKPSVVDKYTQLSVQSNTQITKAEKHKNENLEFDSEEKPFVSVDVMLVLKVVKKHGLNSSVIIFNTQK